MRGIFDSLLFDHFAEKMFLSFFPYLLLKDVQTGNKTFITEMLSACSCLTVIVKKKKVAMPVHKNCNPFM